MGRTLQAFPIGIFADGKQDLTHGRLDARLIEVPVDAHEPLLPPDRERVMRTPAASSIDPFIGASGLRTVTVICATRGNSVKIAAAMSSATASMSCRGSPSTITL